MVTHLYISRLSILIAAIAAAAVLCIAGVAQAHVVVRPSEVATASYQTFTVSTPNEKDIPTIRVELHLPKDIESATPTVKPGWTISTTAADDGETMQSIIWENGSIPEGQRDDFTFSARTPDKASKLEWKAYQTYADGTVVSWDEAQSDNHGHSDRNSGPLSVTQVVSETEAAKALKQAQADSDTATANAQRATLIAFAAIAMSLVGLFFATRKQK